jgi:NADH dehydrogenase
VLVHPGAVILPELGPKLGVYAQKKLLQRGVDIRTNTRVTGVTEHEVTLSDGSTIPSSTVVWTAGTSPNPLLTALPCAKERGRVVVNAYMEVPEWPGVWALGDCALVPDPKTGMP